ncbi:MAG TPA: hypothetical protein VG898_11215 [Solirubrobacterales bacterium]|nr:hypothetical protein [Solirubrobacterales bacterium]
MLKPLVEPSLDPFPAAGRSTFERNVLPAFARWFVNRLDACRPDYLVPAETKGARLLEAVSEYARNELGTAIQVPIVYRTALAYIDAEELRGCRVMILDDARRTGSSLARHRERVEAWGVEEIQEAVCVAYGEDGEDDESCFRVISDRELYREYIWQLTELICARGLPPEVDHHIFEMRLPGSLPLIWGEVEAALGQFGVLGVDAPERDWGEVRGLTLHVPRLPGVAAHPSEGVVRDEGPNKLRLFPADSGSLVHVVPVSFPAIDLPAAAGDGLAVETVQEIVAGWTGRSGSVGDFLARAARRLDPEGVLRMVSASAETDLVCGMARVLAAVFSDKAISIRPQGAQFVRLYGPEQGPRVASQMAMEVDAAGRGVPVQLERGEQAVPLFLTADVVDRTEKLAEGLKGEYDRRAAEPDFCADEQVGKSMPEIAAAVGRNGADSLMASRCVDFGLAMTTLVPYIDEVPIESGIRVLRKYRVSETNKDKMFAFEDISVVYQRIGEETLAYFSSYLADHSKRFRDSNLPLDVAAGLIGVMRSLLEKMKIPLGVEPGNPLVVALRRKPEIVGPREVESEYFELEGAGGTTCIVPSPRFLEKCGEDELRIDRWDITESLENFLDLMLPLIDGIEPRERLDEVLRGWAMSSDRMLGLTHAHGAMERLVEPLEMALNRVVRGNPHEEAVGLASEVHGICDSAQQDVRTLAGDWAVAAESCWDRHSKRVTGLLRSGAPPADTGSLFDLPLALFSAAAATGYLTARLDRISARVWRGQEEAEDGEKIDEIGRKCRELQRALASLEEVPETARDATATRDSIVAVADELQRLVGTLGAFGAALAGDFRGPKGVRHVQDGENERDRVILFMDLAGSFVHAIEHSPEENHAWKELALGCAAQWGKAFGAGEPHDREGDAMWLELEDVGSALLCGATIQMHAHALRSTSVPQLQWSLRMAVDFGRIKNGDGGNAIGLALDRPATLAKKVRDEDSVERVFVTPDALKRCSGAVREEPVCCPLGEVIELAETEGDGASMEPSSIDAERAVAALASKIDAVAARLIEDGASELDATVEGADLQADESAAAEEAASS